LDELPDDINNLKYLEEFSIDNRGLELFYIPSQIKDLTNLKILTIRNANLNKFPEEILMIKI